MRYKPTKKGNEWVTATCSGNGNMGIHDQSQFKSAVLMLENALDNWEYPTLNHLVLTGSTESAYKQFIQELSNSIRSPDRKHWKYALETETDSPKGYHCHLMLILSSDDMEATLGDTHNTTINKIQREIRLTEPTFKVERIEPKRNNRDKSLYKPINDHSLDDAVEWMSYIFKLRSKPISGGGGCYGSSRRQRRCSA